MVDIEKDSVMEHLDRSLEKLFEKRDSLEPGTEESTKVVKEIAELYNLRINETRVVSEYMAKCDQINTDWNLKNEQREMEERHFTSTYERDKKTKRIDWIFRGCEIGVPLAAYVLMFGMGIKFEETQTVTSKFFQNLLNKFKPNKLN